MSSRPALRNFRSPIARGLFPLLLAIGLVAAACTADGDQTNSVDPAGEAPSEPTVLGSTTIAGDTEESEGATTTETPPALDGSLTISGSSTVEGITLAIIDGFALRQPSVDVNLDATGGGFNDLCNDPEIHLIGASRPINGSESASCFSSGVEPVELRLARDGIAVVVNNESELQCLTYEDLYALAGPESTGLTTLESVGALAADLGSATEWGTGGVALIAPGPAHGTAQLFSDFVVKPLAVSRGVGTFLRVDNRSLDSNAQIVDAVAADPNAIGIVGSSYASRNSSLVRMLGVSDGSGCVIPTDAAVTAELYPMSRDLYLYANGASDDPILDDFLFYYLDIALADAVDSAEFVRLSEAEQSQTIARWANR